MIMSVAAVEEDGLLDQPLSQHLGQEIDVLLRATRAQRNVMNADDRIFHGPSWSLLKKGDRVACPFLSPE